jgi:bacillaene synthase trans-acting acyltransferase
MPERDKHKIVFLFSGQGSQYRGMGQKLFEESPVFAASMMESEAIIQRHLNRSLIEELYEIKHREFNDLLMTHPAIVAIELAMIEVMEELDVFPDYVSGSSLGEFSAAVAANIWTKEVALEAAIEQAKSIVQVGVDGGMLAVLNESKNILAEHIAKNDLFVASENFDNHFTVSGKTKQLDDFEKQLDELDITFLRLPVNYPFHSPLIEPAKVGFHYYTCMTPPFAKPSKGFISGIYNEERITLPEDYFWSAIRESNNFLSLVEYMENKGPCLYLDLGPSGTSATFVKYNLPLSSKSITHSIMTPFQHEISHLQTLKELLGLMA